MANLVYKAVVSATSKPDEKFFFFAETTFKEDFSNHTKNFHHKKYANSNELCKYMQKLENEISI